MSEKREIQKEFFEELAQSPKFGRKILGSSTGRRVHNITLSNEQLIFTFIGFVILLVICFSLGVERGKRIAVVKTEAKIEETVVVEKAQEEAVEKEVAEEPVVVEKPPSPYVVQVAAYKDSKQAEKEKSFLEKKGHEIEINKDGKYTVVYVAGFADKNQAQNAIIKLRERYKDCFIRKRR